MYKKFIITILFILFIGLLTVIDFNKIADKREISTISIRYNLDQFIDPEMSLDYPEYIYKKDYQPINTMIFEKVIWIHQDEIILDVKEDKIQKLSVVEFININAINNFNLQEYQSKEIITILETQTNAEEQIYNLCSEWQDIVLFEKGFKKLISFK